MRLNAVQIDVSRHFGLAEDPFRPHDGREEATAPTSLNQDQALGFVRQRLASAGARTSLFSRAALDAVVSGAGGVRHRLRWLAGLSMLEAALEGSRTVEHVHVTAALAQARFAAAPGFAQIVPPPAPAARRSWLPAGVTSGLTAAIVVVLALMIGAALVGPVQMRASPSRGLVPRRDHAAAALPLPRDTALRDADAAMGAPSDQPMATTTQARDPVFASTANASGRAAVEPAFPLRSLAPSQTRVPLIASAPPRSVVPSIASSAAPVDQKAWTPPSQMRVFIHFLPEDQAAAQEVARRLANRGWAVTALREVDAVVSQPNTRFFYDADSRAAIALSDDLADTLGEPVSARDMHDYPRLPRPGTLEVWLPPQG